MNNQYKPLTPEEIVEIVEAELLLQEATPNPVRYYTDGQPYVLVGGIEIVNHPLVDKLAEYDRHEKYVFPRLLSQVKALEAERAAAVREIKSMLMDTCDRTRCVNMECHLDQASCNPKWRGPEPGGEEA